MVVTFLINFTFFRLGFVCVFSFERVPLLYFFLTFNKFSVSFYFFAAFGLKLFTVKSFCS